MITFRMYADVKMNRAVDPHKDYISPGGYCMKMGDKFIPFDFEESATSIDKNNPEIIHIEQKNPDYDSYPPLKEVTKEMIERITEIQEFFVYTGEPGETDLKAVELLGCTFMLPYENWKEICLSEDVCKKAEVYSN